MSIDKAMSEEKDILDAIIPLLKLLSLTLIGLLLAHRKTQIVPKATFKLLSKLVFVLFLPCLIFVNLGESITLTSITQWWFVPINVLISTAIGSVLGVFVVIICRPPPQFTRLTIIMTAFGNTGNLPIALVGSICHDKENLFGPDCKQKGVTYISFAQWVSVILVYTVVYHMMEPPLEYYEIVEEEDGDKVVDEMSKPLLAEAEWPGIKDKETLNSKTPFIARIFKNRSNDSMRNTPDVEADESHDTPKSSVRCLAGPTLIAKKMKIVAEQTPIQHILQPPMIASLLAILVGMVPYLKRLFFAYDDGAPLSVITDSLDILAKAMVPSVMLILGGMLAEGPSESELGVRTTIGIIVARLLLLPAIGIGIVTLADKLNLLVSGDEMYKFVLLLQYTTPSAILLGAIASLRGYAVSESSSILFWQHLLALFSLSLYVIIYFKLVL